MQSIQEEGTSDSQGAGLTSTAFVSPLEGVGSGLQWSDAQHTDPGLLLTMLVR